MARRRNRHNPFKMTDDGLEILRQNISRANKSLLNPTISRYRPNVDEINFHFNGLKKLARMQAPNVLHKIEYLHKVVLDHAYHRISDHNALEKIRQVIEREGLSPNIYNSAKTSLDMKHGILSINPKGNMFFKKVLPSKKTRVSRPKIEQLKLKKPKKNRLLNKSPLAGLKPPRWF